MRLLGAVKGSVLWLSYPNENTIHNLRREAEARGIPRDRLLFSSYIKRDDDHLARLSLADLFLDTLPYNAHATASDALWAGVPVLTVVGKNFPGRVATSLLHAIGMAELAAPSLAPYEKPALQFACTPPALTPLNALPLPLSHHPPHAASAGYTHACLLNRLKRPDEALVSFDRALAIKSDYFEAVVNRGSVLSALKRYDEALSNSDSVLRLKANFAEGWNNRAVALQILERIEEALEAYDRAAALKPNYADAWKNRCALLTILKRHEAALEAADKALTFAPNDAGLLVRRADLLALLGHTEEAAAAYEKYLALKPDDAAAWHALGFALKML